MSDIARDPRVRAAVEAHPSPLVFATVSGAHLYGFASSDSDVDLRGAHVTPLEQVVGLDPAPETMVRTDTVDGLEIDLVTHDIRKFASLLLKRNGYVLEQLLSPLVVRATPTFDELRTLAAGCITRHHARHYLGFAATQWELFARDRPPRVKPLLYCYRVLLTGIHLMRTGETEANLERLLDERTDLADVRDVLDQKRSGAENGVLDAGEAARHRERYEDLVTELEQAQLVSTLPDRPSARREVDQLVVRCRLDLGLGGMPR